MEPRLFRPILGRAAAALSLAAALVPAALFPQAAATAPAAPRPGPAGPAEVRILARSSEQTKDRIFASGDVEIRYGELVLFADRVEYDVGTKDLLAEGNVVLHSGGEVIRAERIRYGLASGRAVIEGASGLVQPSILFEAEEVEKRRAGLYSLKKARVTACAQPNPRWSFSLSRATLESDDHITMRDAVVRIKGVPVLYTPYLRYPLKDRATGFLMPQIGFAGEKGFSLSQSFYWAIAPNMDATVGVDAYLARGTGAGLEYRYLFPGGTRGELDLYYFIYKKAADGARPGNSSIVRLDHTQALPLGFTLVANVDYQTSYAFLREFDSNFQRALSTTRTTQGYLTRSWRGLNLSARVSRFETYFSEIDDANVSTSLPQISFNVFKTRLVAPLYFSLAASYARWQYGWKSEFEAGTERRSSRFSVNPSLSLPFTSIPWLTATGSVTAHFDRYGQSLDPATGLVVDAPLAAANVSAALEIVGPVLYKVFRGRDGRARLKNIVEPFVRYAYDSPIAASDRIVTSYGFFRNDQVSYGVTGRFLFKDGDRAVEVFSLSLGQTRYFSPEDGPLSGFPVDGAPPRFSEVAATLRFYPKARFSFDASAAYNPYYDSLSSLRLSATVGARADGNFLTANWFTSRNSWITGVDPELVALTMRDQVGAFAGLRLPRLAVDLRLEADYNIEQKELLYAGAQVTCHYQCVDILVDVRAYTYRDPPDVQVRLSLGLGSIGRTLDFLGGFGF